MRLKNYSKQKKRRDQLTPEFVPRPPLLTRNHDKLQSRISTQCIPLVPIRLPNPNRQPHAIPLPAPEPLLDHLAGVCDQLPRLFCPRTRRGTRREDDHEAPEHVEHLARLGGEEHGRPLGRVGDEVQPHRHRGRVVGRRQLERVRGAGDGNVGRWRRGGGAA